jgi:hypothetical protein
MTEPRLWAKEEVVEDNPNKPVDEDELDRLWADSPSDEESEWEKGLSAADRRVGVEWIRRVEMAEQRPGTRCRNCKDEKPLRSSGRCYACEKYSQRSELGTERPRELVLKEITRQLKQAGKI